MQRRHSLEPVLLLALVALLAPLVLLACGERKAPVQRGLEPYQKTIRFEGMHIDAIYPSMRGPMEVEDGIDLGVDAGDTGHIWVTRYKAEVLNEDGSSGAQEFMCHSNLYTIGTPDMPSRMQHHTPQLSISQGQKEVVFPEGFALRIPLEAQRQLSAVGMVLNNNYEDIDKKVHFEITFDFYDDRQAAELGLKALERIEVATYVPTPGGGERNQMAHRDGMTCEPVDNGTVFELANGLELSGHWYVPPGRHVYRTPVMVPIGTRRLHYIWMHVHPYAESIELRDVTEQRTVWKGAVHNDPKLAIVHETDWYSSAEGLPLEADHQYEIIAVYDNTTDEQVDAMASLWMYVEG